MFDPHAPLLLLSAALAAAACAPESSLGESSVEQNVTQQPVLGYVMTHEHPTAGMAFGGNYGYAGASANYQNGIP